MTQRERHTPDGEALPVADNGVACLLSNSPDRPARASLWEDWYQRASAAQQQDLLAIAIQKGIVYAPQLTTLPEAPPPRPLLASLLNGHLHDLIPHQPAPVNVLDTQLDAAQRDAVARAITTPDVCLIEGHPGSGKSRVLAEIIRQANLRHQRVLLVAPTAAAIDAVLERLPCGDGMLAVRHLAAEERPEALSPCVRRQTVPERLRSLREEALPAARAAVVESTAASHRRRGQFPLWGPLEELVCRIEELAGQERQLHEQQGALPAAVDAELQAAESNGAASALQAAWLAEVRARDEALGQVATQEAQLQGQLDQARIDLKKIVTEKEQLQPLVCAVGGWRIWSGAFWRGVRHGNVRSRCEELERSEQELTTAVAKFEQDLRDLQSQRDRIRTQADEARQALVAAEVTRRRSHLEVEAGSCSRALARLGEEWDTAAAGLGPAAPTEKTNAALHAARQKWERLLGEEEHQEAFARRWAEAIEQAVPLFPSYLLRSAGVLAATTAALASCPELAESASRPAFDILVLDEAHGVTEAELQAAARHCRRWVLMGTAALGREEAHAKHADRPATVRPGPFQRLWRHLHADPRSLPYTWVRTEDQLICSLRPVPPGQDRWLESEPVADHPEIELRILTPPRPPRGAPRPATPPEPQLAQVVFPANTPVAEAKTFLYRELEELTVQARGSLHWEQSGDAVLLHFGRSACGPGPRSVVPLGDGISEHLEAGTWHTLGLQFDVAGGWDRQRAEDWVAEHLRLRDVGRTAVLAVGHRASPALTAFLSDLLFAGGYVASPHSAMFALPGPAVELIAVPPWTDGHRRERERTQEPASGAAEPGSDRSAAVSVRARSRVKGAGLELELSDTRSPDHLPPDLRVMLPRQGLVNYTEAQAVVAKVQSLLSDPAFLAVASRWQQERGGPCTRPGAQCMVQPGSGHGHAPTIAVMALYPAQVELIRILFRRCAAATTPLSVEIGLPAAFRGRECLAALVSLTRSHSHRAVPFGDAPQTLAEALTRPAGRLILFGDPATLSRRSQWQGAVDHLDEATAHVERRVVSHLVSYLQGHGPHPTAFRMVEGARA
jgi:hypothetical protein